MSDMIIKFGIRAIVLLICIPFHESAHAWMANKMGDSTAKNLGRISMNPAAHLDLMGALMMVLVGFGWGKPCPVNANNFKKPKLGFALTALAGPLSNLLLSFIAVIIIKIIYLVSALTDLVLLDSVITVLYYFMFINLGLAIFNLLPVPPLDGSRIITLFLKEEIYFKIMRYENIFFLILIALSISGLLDAPLSAMESFAIKSMDFLTGWLDLILNAIYKAIVK